MRRSWLALVDELGRCRHAAADGAQPPRDWCADCGARRILGSWVLPAIAAVAAQRVRERDRQRLERLELRRGRRRLSS